MSASVRADGYSLLPLLLLILFWVLFEWLLRRCLSLSPWASVPLGLAACVGFFWLAGAAEDAARHFLIDEKSRRASNKEP